MQRHIDRHTHETQKNPKSEPIIDRQEKSKVKPAQTKHYDAKHLQKYSWVFVYWPSATGHVASLKCELFTQWDSIGENIFFYGEQLSIGDSFWNLDEGLYPVLFSALKLHLAWSFAGPVHVPRVCVRELI